MNWILIRKIDAFVGIPLVVIICIIQKFFRMFFLRKEKWGEDKILLIKFWGIGNILMLLPAVVALKKKFPKSEVDLLTISSNYDVSKSCGLFNDVYSINTSSIYKFLKSTCHVVFLLMKKGYDILIDFEQFARFSALVSALILAPKKIGFHTLGQKRHYIYTDPVKYDNTIHMTRSFFSLVVQTGVEWPKIILPYSIPVNNSNDTNVNRLLNGFVNHKQDAIIVFHVGTSNNFKERRWPPEYYAKLADLLVESYNVKIVLTGLQEEKGLIQEVIQKCRDKSKLIDLCGKLNILEFVSLINLSNFVISPDTSAIHLASSLATPVVGLYGPNTPLLYGPWGPYCISFYEKLLCSPCITNFNSKLHQCNHSEGRGACMKKILPEKVFEEIKKTYFETNLFYPAGSKT